MLCTAPAPPPPNPAGVMEALVHAVLDPAALTQTLALASTLTQSWLDPLNPLN